MATSCSDVVELLTDVLCGKCPNKDSCDGPNDDLDQIMNCMQTDRLVINESVVPEVD